MKSIYKIVTGVILVTVLIYGCTADDSLVSSSLDDNYISNRDGKEIEIPAPAFSLAEIKEFNKNQQAGKSISSGQLSEYADRVKNKMDANPEFYSEDYKMFFNQVLRAINPDDYECDPADDVLGPFVNASVANWSNNDFSNYFFYSDFPLIDAALFQQPSDPQYYGTNGEYTDVLKRSFQGLKRFWNIDGSGIEMYGMHGTTFASKQRVFEILIAFYVFDDVNDAKKLASAVSDYFGSDTFDNYNHPLFSLNAVAFSAPINRIAMGDGIMLAMDAVGLGDIAPQGILAHEYAHQVQFAKGYLAGNFDTPAEATRYGELMADAYSAYYLAHKHGGAFRTFKVSEFMRVFSSIGDCGFSNPGHHGTYNQRAAAGKWGIELYYRTSRGGRKIMSVEQFFYRFNNVLDDIVNCSDCLSD